MEREKIKVYGELCSVITDSMFAARERNKQSVLKALGKKLSYIGFNLFIVAPDDVVHAYLSWRAIAAANESVEQTMGAFSRLLREMRKDLFYPNTALDEETANDLFF